MIELADLLAAMEPAGARLLSPAPVTRFERFAYDSRNLRPGELFLAVRTPRADGHDFIPDAVGRGAAGVIGDHLRPTEIPPNVTAIAVDDTLSALRAWARWALQQHACRVVGVTGGIGKTTAAKAAITVLSRGFAGDPGVFDGDNHNSIYGLSIALGELTAEHQVAVLELLGDEPGELAELGELCAPAVLVVTGAFATPTGDRELAELLRRVPSNGQIIANADDSQLADRLARLGPSCAAPVIYYGTTAAADLRGSEVRLALDSTELTICYPSGVQVATRLPLPGRPAVLGALAGAAVGLALGYVPEEITSSLERLDPLPGRLRPLAGVGGSLILDDTWDASAPALEAGLALLDAATGRKVVVLGELAAAGAPPTADDYATIGRTLGSRVSRVVTVGGAAEPAALAARLAGLPAGEVILTDSAADAARAADLGPGDVALVVGGAEARLERVVERLLADPAQSGQQLVRQDAGWRQRVFLSRERPTWVEVDLAAIGQNVARLKAMVAPAAFLAVLKADAYGHGAVRVARTALLHGADYVATACLGEALELRRHGIGAPILILGFTPPWQAREIVGHDLTATIYDLEAARYLARAARAQGAGRARVHVKVDTGMSRLGLLPPEVPGFFEQLRAFPEIEVEGIFTHFACADGADPAPTRAQIARFDAVLEELRQAGWRPRFVHAANSAGILRFPEARYTMARAGIAMYGLDPSDAVRCPEDFRPALTFKTLVAQVKELPTGTPVSYGGTFVTERPSRIAVLPVGYGDGFRRGPSNWESVLVRGQPARIVGVVCMDMTMIDVTEIPGVRLGDEVVLIGQQGAEHIAVAEVARRLGTVPYEVVTQILARVPREVPA